MFAHRARPHHDQELLPSSLNRRLTSAPTSHPDIQFLATCIIELFLVQSMCFVSEVDFYGFSNASVKNSSLVMKREEEVSGKANMPEAKGVKL